MLSAWTPGLAARVKQQTLPLIGESISRGDVLLAEEDGDLYDKSKLSDRLAEEVANMLRTSGYGRVAMNGISMGGLVARDAAKQLHSNRTFEEYSAKPSLTFLGSPTGATDLTGADRWLGYIPASIPFGALANLATDSVKWVPYPEQADLESGVDIREIKATVDGYNQTPISAIGGQLHSIMYAKPPVVGELDWLASAAYVSFNPNGNPVNDMQAAAKWRKSVGPDVPFAVISAAMNHAGFSDRPQESARFIREVYDFHASN